MSYNKKPAYGSKTKFIMSFPLDTHPNVICREARKQGLDIDYQYVYTARAQVLKNKNKKYTVSNWKRSKTSGRDIFTGSLEELLAKIDDKVEKYRKDLFRDLDNVLKSA